MSCHVLYLPLYFQIFTQPQRMTNPKYDTSTVIYFFFSLRLVDNVDGLPTPFGRFACDGEEHCVATAHPSPCSDFWSCYCLSFICSREL